MTTGPQTILRLVAWALGAIVVMAAILELSNALDGEFGARPEALQAIDGDALARCRDLELEVAIDDRDCAALWDRMRDRFLGLDSSDPSGGG